MSLLSFFLGEKKKSASVAKERELVAVISKYVSVQPGDIKVNVERQDDLEVLEVKIELPERAPAR